MKKKKYFPLLQSLNGRSAIDLKPLEDLRRKMQMIRMVSLDVLTILKKDYQIEGSEQMFSRAMCGRALFSNETNNALKKIL
ncbi:hypothetical protein LCGC14_0910970 [marine sediment metagenome]|uniref:Uncharacterized protein n=1 Tax=marine sediment metagenome TaxID=412755 RepID=A0A0F9RCK1_9ZZZZ|nr:hypothetical protein [Candidatus Aminicenantes bacterium]